MADFEIDPRRTPIVPSDLRRLNDEIITQFRSHDGTIKEGRFKGAPIPAQKGPEAGLIRGLQPKMSSS